MKPGEEGRIPPHPHAGFEVMTYLIDGEFFHRDSKGHEHVAKAGDVNWMSSGSGIVHSEGPTPAMLETGEKLQLMQVWINLPAKDKFANASFQNYPSAGFPVIANGGQSRESIAGCIFREEITRGHPNPDVLFSCEPESRHLVYDCR